MVFSHVVSMSYWRVKELKKKKIKIQFYFVVPDFIYKKSYSSKVSLDEDFDNLQIEQYVALFDFDNARREAVHGFVWLQCSIPLTL